MIIEAKKPERNEPCPCGSGRKYKKCCMEKVSRQLSPQGLQRVLTKVVEEIGGYEISYNDLVALEPDVGLKVSHDPEDDIFTITAVKYRKNLILQPAKRIIA